MLNGVGYITSRVLGIALLLIPQAKLVEKQPHFFLTNFVFIINYIFRSIEQELLWGPEFPNLRLNVKVNICLNYFFKSSVNILACQGHFQSLVVCVNQLYVIFFHIINTKYCTWQGQEQSLVGGMMLSKHFSEPVINIISMGYSISCTSTKYCSDISVHHFIHKNTMRKFVKCFLKIKIQYI